MPEGLAGTAAGESGPGQVMNSSAKDLLFNCMINIINSSSR